MTVCGKESWYIINQSSLSLCRFHSLLICFYAFTVAAVDVALLGLERWPLAEAPSSVPSSYTKCFTNHQASILVLGLEQFYFNPLLMGIIYGFKRAVM